MSESNMQKMQNATSYTPTTEEVRDKFSFLYPAFEGQFDRWLAEVKEQAIAEDREALLRIAKGNNNGCSGHECEECERIMFVDEIVTSRAILMSQFEEYE